MVNYSDPLLQALDTNRSGILGPYFVGCALNLILMGVLAMQCSSYFRIFPNDKKLYRYLVLFLLIAGLFQSACFFEMAYNAFVNGYGDLNVWNNTHWTWHAEPLVSSIIAIACQSFFLHRSWRVSRSFIVLAVAVFGMLAQFAVGIVCSYFLAKWVLMTKVTDITSTAAASTWLSVSAATDIWISAWLVWHLRKGKGHGFSTTDQMIRSLLRLTMETAALTSVWVTINVFLYTLVRNNMAWSIFQFNMGKIYSHTVLYTLHARMDIRGILSSARVVTSSRGPSSDPTRRGTTNAIALTPTILVQTQVVQDFQTMSNNVGLNPIAVAPFEFGDQSAVISLGKQGEQEKDSKWGDRTISPWATVHDEEDDAYDDDSQFDRSTKADSTKKLAV